jgi:hypothetical protein
MGRNYLAHATGDAINTVLAAAGYNFRRLLVWLRFFLLGLLTAPQPKLGLKKDSSRATKYVASMAWAPLLRYSYEPRSMRRH